MYLHALNARIQNTDNFASSGYRSLSQTLASGCKDKLDMDRLKNNYTIRCFLLLGIEDLQEMDVLNIGMHHITEQISKH